jgi:hypothetical protein
MPARPTHPPVPAHALTQSSRDRGIHMLSHFLTLLGHFASVLSHFMIFISHFATMLSYFATLLSHFAIELSYFCDFVSQLSFRQSFVILHGLL